MLGRLVQFKLDVELIPVEQVPALKIREGELDLLYRGRASCRSLSSAERRGGESSPLCAGTAGWRPFSGPSFSPPLRACLCRARAVLSGDLRRWSK